MGKRVKSYTKQKQQVIDCLNSQGSKNTVENTGKGDKYPAGHLEKAKKVWAKLCDALLAEANRHGGKYPDELEMDFGQGATRKGKPKAFFSNLVNWKGEHSHTGKHTDLLASITRLSMKTIRGKKTFWICGNSESLMNPYWTFDKI